MSFTRQQQKGIKKLHKINKVKEEVSKGDPIREFIKGLFKNNPFSGCLMKNSMPRFRPTAKFCRHNCKFDGCPKWRT